MSWIELTFGTALLLVLVAIARIDLKTLTIPDALNALLAVLGLAWSWQASGGFPVQSVLFAAAMLAAMWLVRFVFRLARGAQGLGLGDVKMAGASALWFSPWNAPAFLFFSAISALVFVAAGRSVTGRLDTKARVPFGPFLGVGLFATWLLERSGLPSFIPQGGY
jgi:prepilin signal peptidase PulO-like enzyme (type II secretory pathway)